MMASRGPGIGLDSRRILDLAVGSAALVISLPVLAVTVIAMRLAGDRGPFLYRARRMGFDGKPVVVLKIRTMHEGLHGPGLTSAGDFRVTRVGRLIRQYRIDELPQLVNVVRGEMSLVGPRPEDPRYVDLSDPLHRKVFMVKPGITGPAQIQFRHEGELLAASDDPERLYRGVILPAKLRIDAAYLDRRTVGTDVLMIGQTVLALLPHPFARASKDRRIP
jgi:lipopolysaccharide/colanic/teichoic acid biosynthesis glycosyltransferase